MLVLLDAQKAFPFCATPNDDCHIWDQELASVDEILLDEEFIHILHRAFLRGSPSPSAKGPPRMALNRLLRSGVLKHIKQWSFRDLFKETQRNLDYRAFTQFFEQKTRSVAALSRNMARVDAIALRELNEHLCQIARRHGVIAGRRYRQDTTVCETNIHHPSDSSLLQDGVRVAQRLVKEAEALIPSLGSMRDRSRSMLHRVLEIGRASRSRTKDAPKRREKAYRAMLRTTRAVVTEASRVTDKLDDGRVTRHLDFTGQMVALAIQQELQTMLPRVEQVIQQTRARICRGINDYPDKLLSIFEPMTFVIRKGKAHKATEFGRLVDVVEVENGFVSDYQTPEGNPNDGTLLLPALQRHKERFGRAPHTVATDRGYWSANNEKEAYALGVKRVSIPARGKLSKMRLRLQRSRWFRRAQCWRANGEGRIGTLKNSYGLDRCMYKGDHAMERWVGWCVFAHNLVVVARALQRNREKQDDEAACATTRRGHQKAA
jgi:IS5 family transposase